MRRMIDFACEGANLIGTLDEAAGKTGLLIVSGGNEIRSGAFAGQSAMATHFAAMGHPVFRYDRRGIGDSEGENTGFEGSAADMEAALSAFRMAAPHLERITAFGNCDAASALALFHHDLPLHALLLANPWVIEDSAYNDTAANEAPTTPSAAAIRARYWNRIKNPRSLVDLVTGKIDLKKLATGIAKASKSEAPSGLALRIANALHASKLPAHILIAERDTTALAFLSAWRGKEFAAARENEKITLQKINSSSHSFAGDSAQNWLRAQISEML